MPLKKFFRDTMARKKATSEEGTVTDEDQLSESEETISTEGPRLFGLPLRILSCNRLPRKCIRISFLTINGAAFVSDLSIYTAAYNSVRKIAGITAAAISTWILIDSKTVAGFTGQRMFVILLLVSGVLGALISFLGIVGFLQKRRFVLNAYITCCSLFLCMIFVCAIASVWLFEQLTSKVQDEMIRSIENYRSDRFKETWDDVHRYLRCCGVKSYKDWAKYSMKIPQSCCAIDQCIRMTGNVVYKYGCLNTAVHLLKSYIHIATISALVVSSVSLLSLYFACRFRDKIKRRSIP